MAQYESGSRTPKADLTNTFANVFEVSPQALTVPDIDSYNGLLHISFVLKELYGLKITELDGEVRLHLDKGMDTNIRMFEMFSAWQKQAEKYNNGKLQKINMITGDIIILVRNMNKRGKLSLNYKHSL